MNQAQFKAIAESKYIKLKPERFEAVKDVIFNGESTMAAEKKHNLGAGVVWRDVKRINQLYEDCLNFTKRIPCVDVPSAK